MRLSLAVFDFNTPATGSGTPTTSVATLTLTDTANGVQFVLDPNENNPGYHSHPTPLSSNCSTYDAGSPALTGRQIDESSAPQTIGSFTGIPAARIDQFVVTGVKTEAGYSPLKIRVDFPTSNSGDLRFRKEEISAWTVAGTTIADFTDGATANNKPTPMLGVM